MDEKDSDRPVLRWLLIRIVMLPAVAIVIFVVNLLGEALVRSSRPGPPTPASELFLFGLFPAIALVLLSMPVQIATRRLARERIGTAVVGHIVLAAAFIVSQSVVVNYLRAAADRLPPGIPIPELIQRHITAFMPLNLIIYAALVAGTLAWDNWRLSVRRERTASQLAAELTRAELAALRSKMQPHFLFNALHGISSVMDTDVERARGMMVALGHLLRSSLSASGEQLMSLEQELQFTRDYLALQHMRFEERLQYDLQIDARPSLRIPSFILQPIVENAVVHGMADRPQPTTVRVAVRELTDDVVIEVSDNGPGFPRDILDGTKPLGVGLGALRARIDAMPGGRASMTLKNRDGGGAQVIVRVPAEQNESTNA